MTDESPTRTRANTPERDRTSAAHRDDPLASPLGSSRRAGPEPDSYPLSSTDAGIAGARGHATPGGGDAPSDRLTQANADAAPGARRTGNPGQDSRGNDAER